MVVVQRIRIGRCVAADQVPRAVNPCRHRLPPLDGVLAVVRLPHLDALEHQLLERPLTADKRETQRGNGKLQP